MGASAPTSGTWDTTSPDWGLTSALTANYPYAFPSGGTAVTTSTGNNLLTLTVNSAITIGGLTNNGSGGESNVISGTGSIVLNPGTPATATVEYTATGADQTTITVPITGTGSLQHGAGTGGMWAPAICISMGTTPIAAGLFLREVSPRSTLITITPSAQAPLPGPILSKLSASRPTTVLEIREQPGHIVHHQCG